MPGEWKATILLLGVLLPKKKNKRKKKDKDPPKRGCLIKIGGAIGVIVIIAILIAIGRAQPTAISKRVERLKRWPLSSGSSGVLPAI